MADRNHIAAQRQEARRLAALATARGRSPLDRLNAASLEPSIAPDNVQVRQRFFSHGVKFDFPAAPASQAQAPQLIRVSDDAPWVLCAIMFTSNSGATRLQLWDRRQQLSVLDEMQNYLLYSAIPNQLFFSGQGDARYCVLPAPYRFDRRSVMRVQLAAVRTSTVAVAESVYISFHGYKEYADA